MTVWLKAWRTPLVLLALGAFSPLPALEVLPDNSAITEVVAFAGNADDGMRLAKLGFLAEENHDPAAAVDFLTRALEHPLPDFTRRVASETLHENLLLLKDFKRAKILRETAEKSPEYRDYPERIQWMKARDFLLQRKQSEALAELRAIHVTPRPGDEECRRSEELLARAFNAAGAFDEAAQVFEALAVSAGVNGAWKLRALEESLLNALDAGKPDEAQKLLERIQAEVPTAERTASADRLRNLGWLVKASSGRFAEIAPEFKKAVANAQPDPILSRIALLVAAENKGKATEASLEWWHYAYMLADKRLRQISLQGLIRAQNELGKWTDALQSLSAYFELFPTSPDRWKLRLLAAEINLKLQRVDAARALYESVLNDDFASGGERALAAEALAGLHQKAGRQAEAVTNFRKAIGFAADDAKRAALTQTLGEYLYLLARYEEARLLLDPLAEQAQNPEAAERAALWVVQCDYQLKALDKALARAEQLTDAKTPEVRRKARYLSALLLENTGRTEAAAARYLKFAEEFPKAEEAPAALFQAGELSLGAVDQQAAAIFQRYADLYPGEDAANALFKAYSELLFAGKPDAAEVLVRLEKEYPESKFTIAANFRNVDFLRDSGHPEAALAALNGIESRYGERDADLRAEMLYDRALLFDAMHKTPEALAALYEVTEKYSDRPIAARSYFLLGDIKSRTGDFEGAAKHFRQAEECKPGGELAAACAGRAADAAYALYARTRQERYLAQALVGYETLLKSPTLSPALRFQSMYKLGRVAEDSSDPSRALKLYGEVLYYAVLAHREKAFYAPIWSAKSLQAALTLLEPAMADAPTAAEREALRNEAIRLLTLASELDLPDENVPARLQRLRSGDTLKK